MKPINNQWVSVGMALVAATAQVQTHAQEVAELAPVDVVSKPQSQYVAPSASSGTKTDTPIMETPLNIQVVPQQVLEDQKVTTLDQAVKNVSGVASNNKAGIHEWITMRGFVTNTTFRNGFRIDEYANGGLKTMTNVESVEVMKGPAAILYGRVEPGGMVNLVTKQPQATPYYSVEQQVGTYGHLLTNFDATAAVNEDKTVLYRLNASYEKNDSYRDGVYNQKTFIAPTLKWKVNPQTQVTLEAEFTHNPLVTDETLQLPFDTTTNQFVWMPRNRNLLQSPAIVEDTHFVGLNWSYQFNDDWSIKHQIMSHTMNLKSNNLMQGMGFTQVGSSWTLDRSFVNLEGGNSTKATMLDVTGHFDTGVLKHTLLLGADYYRYETPFGAWQSNTGSTIDINTLAVTGAPLALDPTTYSTSSGINKSLGVYVSDQIKLPNNFHLLAGARYQKVEHSGTSTTGSGWGGTDSPVADTPQLDKATTPRVGLLWQAHDWLSLYGNYAENFGANTGRDWLGGAMKPESAQQKEVGVKAEFFGGKLRGSLAHYDLTKQNVASADLLHPGYMVAIGEVRSRGEELDIQGELSPGWDVVATYAHTDIRISKSTPGSWHTEGNRMENVPQDMASLWTTYEFKQEALHGWKVGGGATYRSSTTDVFNTMNTPGYTLVDAMVSYDFKLGKNKVTAQLNVNNLTNKSYYMDAVAYGVIGILNYGTPRTATASVKVEF